MKKRAQEGALFHVVKSVASIPSTQQAQEEQEQVEKVEVKGGGPQERELHRRN
jgi:hypothetical protein